MISVSYDLQIITIRKQTLIFNMLEYTFFGLWLSSPLNFLQFLMSDKFGAAMAVVKSDIGGNISV